MRQKLRRPTVAKQSFISCPLHVGVDPPTVSEGRGQQDCLHNMAATGSLTCAVVQPSEAARRSCTLRKRIVRRPVLQRFGTHVLLCSTLATPQCVDGLSAIRFVALEKPRQSRIDVASSSRRRGRTAPRTGRSVLASRLP